MEYVLIPAEDVKVSMFFLRIAAEFSDDAAEREDAMAWLDYLEGALFQAEWEDWPFMEKCPTRIVYEKAP